jgi:hypothetical protein
VRVDPLDAAPRALDQVLQVLDLDGRARHIAEDAEPGTAKALTFACRHLRP